MKKLFFLTIVLALLIAGCASAATPTPVQPTVTVHPTPEYIEAVGIAIAPEMATKIQVQVLSSPDPYAKILTTLNPGQQVEVIGYLDTGVWVVIKLEDGTVGWVPVEQVAVTIEN